MKCRKLWYGRDQTRAYYCLSDLDKELLLQIEECAFRNHNISQGLSNPLLSAENLSDDCMPSFSATSGSLACRQCTMAHTACNSHASRLESDNFRHARLFHVHDVEV